MRVLIVGCGYVGLPLAAELIREGHEVIGIRRTPDTANELRAAGVQVHVGDLTHRDFERPSGTFDWVVFTAAPKRQADTEEYRALYLEGMGRLMRQFQAEPPRRFVYAGTTQVYAQTDGSAVKETSPTLPTDPRAQLLLDAETELMKAASRGFPAITLRLASIYGPDRLDLMDRYIRNEVSLQARGARHLNMIHRDDAVGVILAALRSGRPGTIYNAVDDEPVTEMHFYSWLAETLGKWMPPIDADNGTEEGTTALPNRRVSNRRLTMEMGYRLKYPNFRKGYTAEIKSLTDAGLLDIQPEPR